MRSSGSLTRFVPTLSIIGTSVGLKQVLIALSECFTKWISVKGHLIVQNHIDVCLSYSFCKECVYL
jgi:hypothetical protein